MHVERSLKVACSVQQLHPVGTRQSCPLLEQTGACCCNEFELVSDSPSLGPSSPFPSLLLPLYCACTASSRFAFTLDEFSILLYFTKISFSCSIASFHHFSKSWRNSKGKLLDRIYLQSLQKETLCRIASPHISTELIRVFCNLALGQAVVGRIDLS
jgi:hypothetical protein